MTRARKRCEHCNYRWAQRHGLCRCCERRLYPALASRFVQEQRRRALQEARIDALRIVPRVSTLPRELTVGRETFLVVWDGS